MKASRRERKENRAKREKDIEEIRNRLYVLGHITNLDRHWMEFKCSECKGKFFIYEMQGKVQLLKPAISCSLAIIREIIE